MLCNYINKLPQSGGCHAWLLTVTVKTVQEQFINVLLDQNISNALNTDTSPQKEIIFGKGFHK